MVFPGMEGQTVSELLLIMVVCVAVADVSLGAVVLQRNNRSFTNRSFAAAATAMAIWVVTNYLSDQVTANHLHLVFLNRMTVAMGLVSGMLLVAFALSFPHHRATMSLPWQLAFVPGILLSLLAITTPLLVEEVTIEPWGTNIVLGPLYIVLVIWAVSCSAALSVNIFRRYRVAAPREREQFRYLYIGITGFCAVVLLIAGVLPYVLGSNRVAQLIPFAALLFLVPVAYAMLRHHLLDIGWSAIRGAAYTLIIACLAAGMVVLAGRWVDEIFTPIGVDARVGLFIVGLTALLGFQPLRETIEQSGQRVFRRLTYDPSALLQQLGDVISTTLDPAAVASIVSEDLSKEMKLSFAAVSFYGDRRAEVVASGPRIPDSDLRGLLGLPSHNKVAVADELEPDDPLALALAEHGARVVVPLRHDDDLLGELILGQKESGRVFSQRDLSFLGVLATEVGVALRNATLFDELSNRVRELSALNHLAASIGADVELDTMLRHALVQAIAATAADAGSIMLVDKSGLTLSIAAAVGLDQEVIRSAHEQIGEGISGWVAANREPVILVNGSDERLQGVSLRPDVSSAIAVPLVFKDELVGVINLSRKLSPDAFTDENLGVVTSFAGQLAVAVKNAQLYIDLEDTFLGAISSLAAAVDAKDPYTFGHSTEVTENADAIGRQMGLDDDERHTLHIAATLHDIGKIGIDSETLRKPGALNDVEWAAMREHPTIAADILAPLDFLSDAVPLVLFHHERYGGGGYPSGISASAIPLGARIISVADAFNAMVSDRPYRAGLPLEEAVLELQKNSGTQFDPKVVAAFIAILARRGVPIPGPRIIPDAGQLGPTAESNAS